MTLWVARESRAVEKESPVTRRATPALRMRGLAAETAGAKTRTLLNKIIGKINCQK